MSFSILALFYPLIFLGSKFKTFDMKSLFLMKFFITFHYSLLYPNIRTTTLRTTRTASGGFGKEASSLRLADDILETDFLASSIKGCTYESSS